MCAFISSATTEAVQPAASQVYRIPMAKTKSKKDKNASAVKKIARKTLGLVVRVGDALEAVAQGKK